MADAQGIPLGRHLDEATGEPGGPIDYFGERHVIVFGPNGSGKGTRFLVPSLLTLTDRSILVIDPKGELCAITQAYRRTVGKVVILNPFNVLGLGSDGFDPLALLNPDDPKTFYDDASALGEALIRVEGKDPHWGESAQGLLVGLLMWEKFKYRDKASLAHVRTMLTEADEFRTVENEDGTKRREQIRGLRITAADMIAEGGPIIESLVSRFTEQTNELASIRSTANTQTRWMLSPPMADDIGKNGIDFRELKGGPRTTTVYVILPAQNMRTHSVWLRLVIVSALRALYSAGGRRTLFLIDEMPALGHLAPLEDAFGLVRGYKVQIAGICQDLTQLKALYNERWESFLANAGAILGFAPNDLTTAKWMSERGGVTTVLAPSSSENVSALRGERSKTESLNPVKRPAYLPQDLFKFQKGAGLLFLEGMGNGSPFYAPPYWKIAALKQLAAKNPYVEENGSDA
jgi:type IV secretion system protein VirD4